MEGRELEAGGGLVSGRALEAEAGREEDARERLEEEGCVAFMALRKAKVETRSCGIDCNVLMTLVKMLSELRTGATDTA